eukprot:TRINITY_DN3222_c0_g1_i2.p1 TRINITY_DN3222_c0_g1~~TRINITY_DN3222_c0_g1_i2.p1  ORF type:complete len:161 (-),score=22.45 TRINITY_DN3222_c0_g1_i2:20-502(-)
MSLPAGWIEKESRSHPGKKYYFNTHTQDSTWERPTGSAANSPQSSPAPVQKVRASHLLVKHRDSRRPASWKESTITRTKAEAIALLEGFRKRIESGEISFEDLAKKESDCSSAKRGGDLGPFQRGQMQKPFEDAAFGLDIGQMSGIVDTASGVHIVLRTG